MPNEFWEQNRRRLKVVPWRRRAIRTITEPPVPEPPRYSIRAGVLWFIVLFGGGLAMVLALLDNPLAKVRDLRLGTRYDTKPLSSLAAESDGGTLWLGSLGGGLKMYDARRHFFQSDVTRNSSGGKLLSDFVADLDLGSNSPAVGVIVTTDGLDGPGGLQAASGGVRPKFWDKPIVDLSHFPGLTDSNATAIAASADNRYLVFGTHGLGLGVYRTETHSWQPGITSRDGLLSDNVTDLVVVNGAAGAEVIWVATDHGLCAGPLDPQGRLSILWKWVTKDGLAGEQIARLHRHSGFVWYLTHGGGLGRVELDANGGPRGSGAHQLLVSERELTGLGDEHLRLAYGSPVGPTTWFTAGIGQSNYIGRYSEKPCDTTGLLMPPELAGTTINSVSADAASGTALLLGSSHGAWFYRGATKPALENITGGPAGLENDNVREVALGGVRSTAKLHNGEIPWLTTVSNNASPLPWIWTKLVGYGRFPGLTSEADISCVAGESNRLYFGTKNKGIGMWEREGMELTLAMSSQASEAPKRLRKDTSLDLAFVDDALVQVADDHAVDVFREGKDRLELIPSGGAPFGSAEITAVAAQGRYFVAAAKGLVWYYDQAAFRWAGLPNLDEIKRLEFAGEVLWALTSGGQLLRTQLSGESHAWQPMLTGVRGMAVAGDTVYALKEDSETLMDSLVMFSAGAAEEKTIVGSGALPPGDPKWQQAAAVGGDLYLLGSGQALQHYSLADRKWKSIRLPDDLHPPFKQTVRTSSGWYLLDASGSLHCFRFGDGHFSGELESGVERIDALGSGVLARRALNSESNLLVLRGEGEDPTRVVVGLPFQGDLGQIIDATEWNGQLVVAESDKIGIYDWASHSWVRHFSSAKPLRRFYSSGTTLWAQLAGEAGLIQVGAEGVRPVEFADDALPLRRISPADGGLYVLDQKNRVHFVSDGAPTKAVLRLAATALSGGTPASGDRWSLLDDAPVVARGSQIQIFRGAGGPPVWQATDLGAEIKLLAGDGEHKLLAATLSGVSVVQLDREGKLLSRPIELPRQNGEASPDVKSLAVTRDGSLIGAQAAGETGLRVWSVDAGSTATPVLGASLPNSGTTRAVVELPDNSGLARLDETGTAAEYTLDNHSWAPVAGPKMDSMFRWGEKVYGFSRTAGSLYSLSGTDWSRSNSSSDQITNVQVFPKGILLRRADGHLGLCAGRSPYWCWSPRPPRDPIAALGEITDVAQMDECLILLGAGGTLVGYDWATQQWVQSNIKDGRQLVRQGTKVYVVRGAQNSQTLAGPVALAAGEITAGPLESTTPLRSVAVAGGDIFALGLDGRIGRLNQRRFEPWWGRSRAQGPAANPPGGAFSAFRTGDDLRVVLQHGGDAPYVLKADLGTLSSEIRPLPPGKIERVFAVTNQSIYAIQTTPEGRRIFDLISSLPAAPPFTNEGTLGFADGKFKIATPESVLELNGGQWETVTNKPLDAAATNQLATTLATPNELLVPDPAGAWLDGRNAGGRLSLSAGPAEKGWRLLPSRDGNGLAAENVNDIASNGDALVAATDGGIVEFQPNRVVAVGSLFVPEGAGVSGLVSSFTNSETPVARTAEGHWFGPAAGTWQEVPAPNLAAALPARIKRANGLMENWRWVQGRDFQRKTRAGQFRDAHLVAGGFDFEFVEAAEVGDDGGLWLHTATGSLLYKPGSAEASPPEDITPQAATPAGFKQGFVLASPDGTRWLSSSPEAGPAAAGPLWVGNSDGWQAATPGQQQVLRASTTNPLLDSTAWHWDRPGAQEEESVALKLAAGGLSSTFSRKSGRFGWDLCYDVGQAKGESWMLTEAGLFRVREARIDVSSRKAPVTPASQSKFVETGGSVPGGLAQGNNLRAVYDGSWQALLEAAPSVPKLVQEVRFLSRQWKLRRDGGIERLVPGSDGRFALVHLLPNGVWDFETVANLAASKENCLLATAAGLVGLRGASSFAGWWPELGQASQLEVVGQLPIAEAAGRRFEFNGDRWAASNYRGPLVQPVTNDLMHFRVVRPIDGRPVMALKLAGGSVQELPLHGNRLPFDEVSAAALIGDAKALTVTSFGLWEIAAGGDLRPGPAMGQSQNHDVDFFRLAERPDEWVLYARTGEGTYRWAEGWQSLASGQVASTDKLRRDRLALSPTWQVDAVPGAGPAFRLRLKDDRNNHYRVTPFDAEHGRFGFDALLSVACSGDALYLGSRAGLERLDEGGGLRRLWCQRLIDDQVLDGIGPEPVEQLAVNQAKVLQLGVSGNYYQVETEESAASPSTRERYVEAAALRHAEPTAWKVVYSRDDGQALRMWWSGQRAFLVPADDGKLRFAHNVVHSATEVNVHLALGTAGGLLILEAINATPGESSRLLSEPFQSGSATNEPPAALNWLQRQDRGTLVATSVKGAAWRVSETEPKVIGQVPPLELANLRGKLAAEDDLLQWRHPDAGKVTILFAPDKVFPAEIKPEIQNGTFTFADLRVGDSGGASNTIAASPWGLFWLTRAGVMQINTESGAVIALQQSTADKKASLSQMAELRLVPTNSALYARGLNANVTFDALNGRWRPAQAGDNPFHEKQMVNASPMLEWRQESQQVRVRMKSCDQPDMPLFRGGKPPVDRVHEIAFVTEAGTNLLLMATDGGVVVRDAGTFEFCQRFAAAFSPDAGSAPVESVITVAEGDHRRQGARTPGGHLFERNPDGWKENEAMKEVFETGYLRVKDPARWSWSRYPTGLSCRMEQVNGPALSFGRAVDAASPPAFSRGKISIDDIRGAALAGSTILAATPAGIVRYDLSPQSQRAEFAGLDIWARESPGEKPKPVMTGLLGVAHDHGLQLWSDQSVFANVQGREWTVSPIPLRALRSERQLVFKGSGWRPAIEPSHPHELRVDYRGFINGNSSFVPISGTNIINAVASRGDLWVLTSDGLYEASEQKLRQSIWQIIGLGRNGKLKD